MAQPIRWGILGTGDINRKLLRGARLSSEVQVVAVGSRDPGRAAAFAKEYGIPRSFGSYEGLLADPGVDAV
jgi:predicted dehydrogenase